MPQQIIVTEHGRTTIVPTGPVGPPGPEGPQGPPGDSGGTGGRHGLFLCTTAEETIDSVTYQVADLTGLTNEELANIVVDPALSKKLFIRTPVVNDVTAESSFDISLTVGDWPNDPAAQLYVEMGSLGLVPFPKEIWAFTVDRHHQGALFKALPTAGELVGSTSDYYMLYPITLDGPRSGSNWVDSTVLVDDPDGCDIQVDLTGVSGAFIATRMDGSKAKLLIPANNSFQRLILTIAPCTVNELVVAPTGGTPYSVKPDINWFAFPGVCTVEIIPTTDPTAPLKFGGINSGLVQLVDIMVNLDGFTDETLSAFIAAPNPAPAGTVLALLGNNLTGDRGAMVGLWEGNTVGPLDPQPLTKQSAPGNDDTPAKILANVTVMDEGALLGDVNHPRFAWRDFNFNVDGSPGWTWYISHDLTADPTPVAPVYPKRYFTGTKYSLQGGSQSYDSTAAALAPTDQIGHWIKVDEPVKINSISVALWDGGVAGSHLKAGLFLVNGRGSVDLLNPVFDVVLDAPAVEDWVSASFTEATLDPTLDYALAFQSDSADLRVHYCSSPASLDYGNTNNTAYGGLYFTNASVYGTWVGTFTTTWMGSRIYALFNVSGFPA